MNGLYKRDKEAEKSAKKYSIIHWQTGEPSMNGRYLVTFPNGEVNCIWWDCIFRCWKNSFADTVYNVECWCKLSDIKPCVIHQQESDNWIKFNQDEMVR